MKTTFGVLLLLLAVGNIVYDGIHPKAHMGALAILLTAVAAAAGALLVRRQRKPT